MAELLARVPLQGHLRSILWGAGVLARIPTLLCIPGVNPKWLLPATFSPEQKATLLPFVALAALSHHGCRHGCTPVENGEVNRGGKSLQHPVLGWWWGSFEF